MKQYLHSSGPTLIVACNNVAYALISQSLGGENGDDHHHNVPLIVELASSTNDVSVSEIGNADKGLSPAMLEQKQMNSIQSVASLWVREKNMIFYAVSRYDKSLSIYCVSNETLKQEDEKGENRNVIKVVPTLEHKSNKRICSLSFASVPSSSKANGEMTVIIGGDLNGDATAYPVATIGESNSNVSRVLLSHTASMLTNIEIFDNGKQSTTILTSDRDEKVRVSSFTNTYHVEGYLLGHSNFVSDVKIFKNYCLMGSKCVTCGGDNTLRIFDYKSMKELSMLNIPVSYNTGKPTGEAIPIPVRLATNLTGSTVAVIYDSFHNVEIFSVASTSKLEFLQSIQCDHSPLGVSFGKDSSLLILTREPSLLKFKSGDDGLFIADDNQIITSFCSELRSSERKMPPSLMETDERSGKSKLQKQENRGADGFGESEPWLKRERVEVYKKSVRRRKHRKHEKAKETIDTE